MTYVVEMAKKFLVKHKLYDYPLTLERLYELGEQLEITLLTYSEGKEIIERLGLKDYTNLDAFIVNQRNNGRTLKVIFYNGELQYHSKLFSILHEIAHHELNHVDSGKLLYEGNTERRDIQEREADTWAEYVAAPICILAAENIRNVRKIMEFAALNREQAQHIYTVLANYGEPDVLDQQIIEEYKKRHGGFWSNAHKLVGRFRVGGFIVALCMAALAFMALNSTQESDAPMISPESSLSESSQSEPSSQVTQSEVFTLPSGRNTVQYVYITEAGDKYHRSGCQYLRTSGVRVTLETAQEMGKEPCLVCEPPR